jgi:DNA polymerase-3 subunit delta'
MIWQTFGHQNVKSILNKQLESKKFSHAYLFSGPEGVGKKTLCLEFAKQVLNTEKLENHPDFQILDLNEEEIKVESLLDFIRALAFKPFMGAKKVAIINNAENLNPQSGNALLKTLEEPSPSTIIILIASSLNVLPTIVSRCQKFNFNVFSADKMREFAAISELQITKEILGLSFGRISRLKRLLEDKKSLFNDESTLKDYQDIGKMQLGEKLISISKFSDKENSELEQDFQLWLNWQLGQLGHQPKSYTKLQALSDALLGLKQNYNKKLVLQSLFLQL